MPSTKAQLAQAIEDAYDFESEKPNVDPVMARMRIAVKIADAVEAYTIGRNVAVTGVQPGTGAATGLIQ